MFYSNEAALKAFTDDLRAFVSLPAFDVAIRPVRGGGRKSLQSNFEWSCVRAERRRRSHSACKPPSTRYAGRTGIADRVDSLVLRRQLRRSSSQGRR